MTPEQIKQLRANNNLSIKDLADSLGVSPRTVESWEQGLRTPAKPAQILIKKIYKKS